MPYLSKLSTPLSVLRMSTDVISNVIAITQANPVYAPSRTGLPSDDSTWAKAILDGTLHDDLIWVIIHETTHHCSLDSVVGGAISALAVSHTSYAGWESRANEQGFSTRARDMAVSVAINRLVSPILEGLAMFAEFDATSDRVDFATWTSLITHRLFTFPDSLQAILTGEDIIAPLKEKLESLRCTSSVVQKKELLLSGAIDHCQQYLLGYFLIKAFWCDLNQRTSFWRHSDLFIMFFSDYFFGDYQLAEMLLGQPGLSVSDQIATLETYIYNRCLNICKNYNEVSRQFLEYYSKPGSPLPAYANYSDELKYKLKWELTKRSLRGMHYQTADFANTRFIPRILAAPAMLSIDEDGTFTAEFSDGNQSISGPALHSARPVSGEFTQGTGSVEAVALLPIHGRKIMKLLLCVFIGKDLVATFDPQTNNFNENDDADTCDKMGSYLAHEAFAEQVDDERNFPKDCEEAEIVAGFSGEHGVRKMIELWGPLTLIPDVGEAGHQASHKLFEQGGLKEALSLNNEAFKKLVTFSLLPIGTEISAPEDKLWIQNLNIKSTALLGFKLLNLDEGCLAQSRI